LREGRLGLPESPRFLVAGYALARRTAGIGARVSAMFDTLRHNRRQMPTTPQSRLAFLLFGVEERRKYPCANPACSEEAYPYDGVRTYYRAYCSEECRRA